MTKYQYKHHAQVPSRTMNKTYHDNFISCCCAQLSCTGEFHRRFHVYTFQRKLLNMDKNDSLVVTYISFVSKERLKQTEVIDSCFWHRSEFCTFETVDVCICVPVYCNHTKSIKLKPSNNTNINFYPHFGQHLKLNAICCRQLKYLNNSIFGHSYTTSHHSLCSDGGCFHIYILFSLQRDMCRPSHLQELYNSETLSWYLNCEGSHFSKYTFE